MQLTVTEDVLPATCSAEGLREAEMLRNFQATAWANGSSDLSCIDVGRTDGNRPSVLVNYGQGAGNKP